MSLKQQNLFCQSRVAVFLALFAAIVVAPSLMAQRSGSTASQDRTQRHFTHIRQLARVLGRCELPENSKNLVVVVQEGGKTDSWSTSDVDSIALADVVSVRSISNDKRSNLANVAVLQEDGKVVRFVDVRKLLAPGKPTGITLKRGDIVVVPLRREKRPASQ